MTRKDKGLPKIRKTTKQLIRCETGEGERNGYCVCHGALWEARRVTREEELSTLPSTDPHYVRPQVFQRRAARRTVKMGYVADLRTGAPVGKQMTIEDFTHGETI